MAHNINKLTLEAAFFDNGHDWDATATITPAGGLRIDSNGDVHPKGSVTLTPDQLRSLASFIDSHYHSKVKNKQAAQEG